MTNRQQPHIHLLPEDKANAQIATGFILGLDESALRRIQILPEVGGWGKVLSAFETDYVSAMNRYAERLMILLIDFDGDEGRMATAKARIPSHLHDRVFILGVWTEPEKLKAALGASCEAIGASIAKDCREETDAVWQHDLLKHNVNEIERLRQHVRPILFPRRHSGPS